MIKSYIFLYRYNILKCSNNLITHKNKFYKLKKKEREFVLDKFFSSLSSIDVLSFSDFFDDYYFCVKLIEMDYGNLKYIDYFNLSSKKIDKIILNMTNLFKGETIDIERILIDGNLPSRLLNSLDFIDNLIDMNYCNIKYLVYNEKLADYQDILIDRAIEKAKTRKFDLKIFLVNNELPFVLCRNVNFIKYIIGNDYKNIKYICWNNFESADINNIIDFYTDFLYKNEIKQIFYDDVFLMNFNYMSYLLDIDLFNIKYSLLNNNDNDKLIDIFFDKLPSKRRIKIDKFLLDDGFINDNLLYNYRIFSYLFSNCHNIINFVNFNTLNKKKEFICNLIKIIDNKNYEFNNDDFLINDRYPAILSGSHMFMKYVIDKNFNNLSYISLNGINDEFLRNVINYACKMVYYIRGNNKLSFDIDGYFINSDIIKNKYFLKCLECL